MNYPHNYEDKIGFTSIREMLSERCLSTLGREMVEKVAFSSDASQVNQWLEQVREFRLMLNSGEEFPLNFFFDVREAVSRLRLEGTHIEEEELFCLRRSLDTIHQIVSFLRREAEEEEESIDGKEESDDDEVTSDSKPRGLYPSLFQMTEGVRTFPDIVRAADRILDKYGRIADSASPELLRIRRELKRTESGISQTLSHILRSFQSEGLVDKDAAPALRDGRLVIPVAPGLKRKINGIVHDESASGKTVFIEPQQVVEANNRVRELESEQRREIVRILVTISAEIRPHVKDIVSSYKFLAKIDLLNAKASLAERIHGIEPKVEKRPVVDWIEAYHPLLRISLEKQQRKTMPLDVMLTPEKRMLIISGPNAGGKSVCLKTIGLLQYMLQCGLSVPLNERSRVGVFSSLMIDIGDEQSIADDLSTYSSHLLNMKMMLRGASPRSLVLIDEFGTGTEPAIGGAIAEAVLNEFCEQKTYGVITTHYQNLKHFADSHHSCVNGAMLYDRHEMRPLFQLAIGRPGSSFAIEIARKTGLPEKIIKMASDIVGSDYIQSDKYLQDIVRDKRYWEAKRQNIHQKEKHIDATLERYETDIQELEDNRKAIIRKAKQQAEELLAEANRKIENTIREIKEAEAEKERTRRIREELESFREEVSEIDSSASDALIEKKMQQILARKQRKLERKAKKAADAEKNRKGNGEEALLHGNMGSLAVPKEPNDSTDKAVQLVSGDVVRMKGSSSVGTIEKIDGKQAMVVFGQVRSRVALNRLERTVMPKKENNILSSHGYSRDTRQVIDEHRSQFRQDLDVRGMRGDEALNAVTSFIDDAILVGVSRVRILHGKGDGILRHLIRQYLGTVPSVEHFADEHIQFGGNGITVVDL